MPAPKVLMIQGTGSHVGKSVTVAALCRIFAQDGYRVAPFKAQNMALNSFVTQDGKEMGRAQVVQAQAAMITPSVLMNPVLIKPNTDTEAQVIVMGRPIGTISAQKYGNHKSQLWKVIRDAFSQLARAYDLIIIEGAGSPAEVNLRDRDLVNMATAKMANAPVLLVGDIDKGGVFAWFIGTLHLLSPDEQDRVKGYIINKFRGDTGLLRPGIEFLERETKKSVLGVIPYFHDIRIPEEDALPEWSSRSVQGEDTDSVRIAIIALPHLSNFTDFDPLERGPGLRVSYIRRASELGSPDLLILPGTKATVSDLIYLRENGFEEKMRYLLKKGVEIVGICGGYQMLGEEILDPLHVESRTSRVQGLGLLPVITRFERKKSTYQVRARHLSDGLEVVGYEIHHGQTAREGRARPAFKIIERSGQSVDLPDGAVGGRGQVWGTSIHGLFDNRGFRDRFLNRLREKKGLPMPPDGSSGWDLEHEFDRLADLFRHHLKMNKIYRLLSAFLFFLILGFSGSLLAEEVSITDATGRRITLERPATRIVSLAPSLTETLFALGAGVQVVGVTDFCDYPAEAHTKARVGGVTTFSVERILSLRPDLVLAIQSLHGEALIQDLRQAGLTVAVFEPVSLSRIFEGTRQIGVLTDRRGEAERLLATLTERLKKVETALAPAPSVRVLYVLWQEPLMTVGSGSFITEMIRRAGGIPIGERVPRAYFEIDLETVLREDPAVIVLPTEIGSAAIEEARSYWQRWPELTAVREKRISVIDSDLVHRPGPRVVDGVEALARLLHPRAFE